MIRAFVGRAVPLDRLQVGIDAEVARIELEPAHGGALLVKADGRRRQADLVEPVVARHEHHVGDGEYL